MDIPQKNIPVPIYTGREAMFSQAFLWCPVGVLKIYLKFIDYGVLITNFALSVMNGFSMCGYEQILRS